MPHVTLLHIDDCPNWTGVERDLVALADEVPVTLTRHRVGSDEEGARLGFGGSPTVLVDGVDPFPRSVDAYGIACRIYATPDGLRGAPTRAQLRAALRDRALAPPEPRGPHGA